MERKDIIGLIERLSLSQGFYGRLLRDLDMMDEDMRDEWFDSFCDCEDILDVIMRLEE